MKTRGKRPAWSDRLMPFALALLLAAPAVLLAVRPGVWVGNGTDLYSYQLPMRRLVRALWLSGELPTWNPYVLGGVPLLGGMQLGVLYPPNLLGLLLPTEQALCWLRALHLAWLALGGLALGNAVCRAPLLRWSRGGVAAAALLVAAGPTWGHIWPGHVSFVQAWSWAPWIAALLIAATRDRRWSLSALAAAALAMQLLAGHPQVSYLGMAGTLVLLLAFGPGRGQAAAGLDPTGAGERQSAPRRVAGAAAMVALALLLGAALAAAQLWPTWELSPLLNRGLDTRGPLALSFSAPPRSLWTAIAPQAFGGTAMKLAPLSYHETLAHVGAAGIALAAAALLRLRPRHVWLALALAVFALLSAGRHGPLMAPLLGWVPGLDAFRVPSRWMVPAMLVLATLAAETADGWGREAPGGAPGSPQPLATLALGIAALAVLLLGLGCSATGGWWADLLDPRRVARAGALDELVGAVRLAFALTAAALALAAAAAFVPGWRRAAGLGLTGWLLIEAVAFGGAHAEAGHTWAPQRLDWPAETIQALTRAVGSERIAVASRLRQADWGGSHGLRSAGGYEPAVPERNNRWANRFAGRPASRYAVNLQVRRPSPWLDRAAVRLLLRHRADRRTARRFAGWPLQAELPGSLVLQRNPAPMPRWQVADKIAVEPDATRAMDRVGTLPRDLVLLSRPLPHVRGAGGTIAALRDGPSEVTLAVELSERAVVVLRDTALAGWRVEVDGEQSAGAIADGLFRAVSVPAGRHVVRWTYRPPGLLAGSLTSALAWLSWGAWLWVLGRRRRGEATRPQTSRLA